MTKRGEHETRAVGVVRLSRHSGRADDPSTSPERQRDRIEATAAARGLTIVGWATDLGVSAAKVPPWDRPDLGEWLQRPDDWDCLIFWKLDRLCRSVSDFSSMVKWVQPNPREPFTHHRLPALTKEKNLISTAGDVDLSTPTGRAMAQVVAVFAELEAAIIKERVNEGRQEVYEQGRWPGGRHPFGYKPARRDGGGWKLIHDPETAPIVRELVRRVIDGEPMYAVQLDFQSRGLPTPKGGESWLRVNVGKILRSRALLGEATFKAITADDGIPVDPVRAEPLISVSEWTDLQDRLGDNGKRQRFTGTSVLLDIAFCAFCGEPLYQRNMERKDPKTGEVRYRHRYYGCGGRWSRRNECDGKSVRAERLEAVVQDLLLSHVGDLEFTRTVRVAGESHADEIRELSRALDDLLARSAGKGEAVAKVYAKRIGEVEEKLSALSELPEKPAEIRQEGTGESYRDRWMAADLVGRRRLLLDSGIRVEATRAGDTVSLGLFDRPEGYAATDVAVVDGIQVALWLPEDLAKRASGDPAARLTYRQRPLSMRPVPGVRTDVR
jgi:site-specific DNA recombinase